LFSPEAMMAKRIKGVYSIVNRLHEPIPPIGSDDYALTGNVTAGSFGLFIRTLMGLARHPERYGNAAAPATPRSGSRSSSGSSSGVALVAATRGLDEVRVPHSRRQLARNKMRCVPSTCRRGESAFSRTPARSCALVCVSPPTQRDALYRPTRNGQCVAKNVCGCLLGGWSGARCVCELDVGVLRLFTRLLDP
jgi:hypothetical protein